MPALPSAHLVQMPRTGSYLMVRLADAARCNTTLALAAAGAAGEPAAAVGAQAGLGDSAICVGRMIAQEGGWEHSQ